MELIDELKKDIMGLKEWENLKFNHQLIISVAEKIDDKLRSNNIKDKKVDKHTLLLEILKEVFNLNENEEKAVQDIVNFLIEDKKILGWFIKKSSLFFFQRLKNCFYHL